MNTASSSDSSAAARVTTVNPVRTNGSQTEQLLEAVIAFRNGNFSHRLPGGWTGINGKIADALNDVFQISERRAREMSRITGAVGRRGNLMQRLSVPDAVGGWADEVESINSLIDDLVWPTKEVTRAVGAIAMGDLGQSIALEVD